MNDHIRNAFGVPLVSLGALVFSAYAEIRQGESRARADVIPTGFGELVDRDVASLRAATEAFKVLDHAVTVGYERHVSACVENPPHGGMGFHHQKTALLDAVLEVDKPEILVYGRMPDGTYKLNGVEYIVPCTRQN